MPRKKQEVERTRKNYLNTGYVFGLIIMYLIWTPIVSLIVSSLLLFILMTILIIIQLYIGFRVWSKGTDLELLHRLMGFFFIFNMGMQAVLPFLFLSFGTIFFHISLGIYLILLGSIFTKSKLLSEALHNPSESKIGKAFMIIGIVIVFLVIPANYGPPEGIIMQLLTEKGKEMYTKIALYLLGILLTMVLPIFFKPVQKEYKEEPKGRRKLSRAKRKALQAKQR